MRQKPFSLTARIKSIRHACRGIYTVCTQEHNMRVHIGATIVVLLTGYILEISTTEWIVLSISIALVIAAELINTAIEKVVDMISLERSDNARDAKDIAAAAVFILILQAAITGLIIFVPKLVQLYLNYIHRHAHP